MAKLNKIKIKAKDLSNLPLFFGTIYFNDVQNINDENYLNNYNSVAQAKTMRLSNSSRFISKTIYFKNLDGNTK